jgi:hypothetical protein
MSRALSLAGFQVTLIGRFWVTTEVFKVGANKFTHLGKIVNDKDALAGLYSGLSPF